MVTFLGINGHEFDAPEADVVAEFVALGDGRVSENQLADWIRARVGKAR
jgi:prophage maintenance system killer protein